MIWGASVPSGAGSLRPSMSSGRPRGPWRCTGVWIGCWPTRPPTFSHLHGPPSGLQNASVEPLRQHAPFRSAMPSDSTGRLRPAAQFPQPATLHPLEPNHGLAGRSLNREGVRRVILRFNRLTCGPRRPCVAAHKHPACIPQPAATIIPEIPQRQE
jgi:hypothetical protein